MIHGTSPGMCIFAQPYVSQLNMHTNSLPCSKRSGSLLLCQTLFEFAPTNTPCRFVWNTPSDCSIYIFYALLHFGIHGPRADMLAVLMLFVVGFPHLMTCSSERYVHTRDMRQVHVIHTMCTRYLHLCGCFASQLFMVDLWLYIVRLFIDFDSCRMDWPMCMILQSDKNSYSLAKECTSEIKLYHEPYLSVNHTLATHLCPPLKQVSKVAYALCLVA